MYTHTHTHTHTHTYSSRRVARHVPRGVSGVATEKGARRSFTGLGHRGRRARVSTGRAGRGYALARVDAGRGMGVVAPGLQRRAG